MKWRITVHDEVVILEMRSNSVNKMNPEYFRDLNEAIDTIEREHPSLPLVLTASGRTFSAGLDFEDVFPRFTRNDLAEIWAWFDTFRGALLRIFTLPRRTVAAVNGSAYAGGLILALGCDVRIAAAGSARFSINEVPIGIPMPGVFTEIVRYAVGTRTAADAILSGQIYDVEAAHRLGFVHQVVPPEQLLDEALKQARVIAPDCHPAYATSKKALQLPALRYIAGDGAEMDLLAIRTITAPESQQAQARALAQLKTKPLAAK